MCGKEIVADRGDGLPIRRLCRRPTSEHDWLCWQHRRIEERHRELDKALWRWTADRLGIIDMEDIRDV